MLNKNELILDRVRALSARDLETGKVLFRLTTLEDSKLQTTAEGDEVTDAVGALITKLYRAKKAVFSATNSLISLNLLAAQYGTEKEVADTGAEIIVPTYDILTVDTSGTVTLLNTPVEDIKYIYALTNNEISDTYELAVGTVDATHFTMTDNVITVPTGLKGKVYVEYDYKSTSAMKVSNKVNKFPEACSILIDAIFKDKCNENTVYAGKILAEKAKLNPEQVETALTSTGKHPFEFTILSGYCDGEDAELFSVILAE